MKTFIRICLIFLLSNLAQAKTVEQVLAVVEGQMILLSELSEFKKNFSRKNLVNENLIDLYELKNAKSKTANLDYLITKKIILNDGLKNQNLQSVSDSAEQEINLLAKQNKISYSQLKKEIISRGISFNNYKNFIGESAIIRNSLERNVISKVRPTEEDFVGFLKSNGVKNILSSSSFELEQIFFPTENPNTTGSISAIESSNFKYYFKNAEKFNFDALKLGVLKESDLSSTHLEALKNLNSGQVTQPIKEASGYRVFYIVNKTKSFKIPNTSEVKKFQQSFYSDLIKNEFRNWVAKLKDKSFIRINK